MSKVYGMNSWKAIFLLLVLTFGSCFADLSTTRIRSVHVKVMQGSVKVFIQASKPLQYRVTRIEDPIRAYIFELYPAVLWGNHQQTRHVGQGGVREVRVAQFSSHPEIVRVVVELDKDMQFSAASLKDSRMLLLSFLSKQAEDAPVALHSNFAPEPSQEIQSAPMQSQRVQSQPNPQAVKPITVPVASTENSSQSQGSTQVAGSAPPEWDNIKIERKVIGPPDLSASESQDRGHDSQVPHLRPIMMSGSFKAKLQELYLAKASKITKKKTRKKVAVSHEGGLVSFSWKNADLTDVIRSLADRMGLNVIVDTSVKGSVTLDLKNVPASQAMSMVLAINGYSSRQVGNILVVGAPDKLEKLPTTPLIFGPQALQVIPLEHAKPSDIRDTIMAEYPEVKVEVEKRTNSLLVKGPVVAIRKVKGLVAELDKPIVIPPAVQPKKEVIQLNYALVKDVIVQIKPLLPPDAVLIADERLNSIIVIGTDYVIGTVHSFVSAVDIPLPQVMLEMQVVSVNETVNRDLGIDWDNGFKINFAESAAGEGGVLPSPGGATITGNSINLNQLGFHTLVRDNIGFQSRIRFLVQQNKAKVLGAPRVATLNNKEANIQLGDRIPILYFDPRAGITQAQYIDVGVILKITPSISPDGSITVHVTPQVSQVTGFVQNFPQVSTRQADTTVRVKNGETIVLGGLLRDTNTDAVTKIPLLGDIPILGEFFRHRTQVRDRTDLIITITPTLMANR